MRKIVLLILSLSIFVGLGNFSYASTNLEIESIYNDLISKVESRMNTAISDLEKMYENSISRNEDILNSAIASYERTQQSIARQSNAAASYDLSLANEIARKGEAQLIPLYNNILTIRASLDNFKAEKVVDLNELKAKYQKQIDDYKLEMNNLINQNNNSLNTNSSNNSSSNNITSCGLNSSPSGNGNCSCNSGYTWQNPNDNKNFDCVKKKTYNEICQEQYGANTYGDDKNCYCNSGYMWNSSKTSCIKEIVKTPDQLCKETYGNNSIVDGKQNNDGTYNCSCKTGYIWNSNNKSCIKEEKKETLKEAIEKQKEEIKNKDIENKSDTFGLSDKQLKSINKSFDNIKNKLSKLVVEKRDATYKKLNTKIDILLGKQKSEKNKNILKYLKSLVEKEIEEIKWEEEGMTIDELLN